MANKIGKDTDVPNKGRGRPKGALNRVTKGAKEAIEYAASGLGGGVALLTWAKSDKLNERIFWGNIYPKLLPLQVTGDPDNPLHTVNKVVFEVVNAKG